MGNFCLKSKYTEVVRITAPLFDSLGNIFCRAHTFFTGIWTYQIGQYQKLANTFGRRPSQTFRKFTFRSYFEIHMINQLFKIHQNSLFFLRYLSEKLENNSGRRCSQSFLQIFNRLQCASVYSISARLFCNWNMLCFIFVPDSWGHRIINLCSSHIRDIKNRKSRITYTMLYIQYMKSLYPNPLITF